MDHIKPISNEFGIRGRIPRYRLGRYGPHSNDALLEIDSPSDVVANASIKVQNMSRISGNIVSYSQAVLHVQLCIHFQVKFRPSRKRQQLAELKQHANVFGLTKPYRF